ncbi:hypothetical protein [Priestia aryabhattai]
MVKKTKKQIKEEEKLAMEKQAAEEKAAAEERERKLKKSIYDAIYSELNKTPGLHFVQLDVSLNYGITALIDIKEKYEAIGGMKWGKIVSLSYRECDIRELTEKFMLIVKEKIKLDRPLWEKTKSLFKDELKKGVFPSYTDAERYKRIYGELLRNEIVKEQQYNKERIKDMSNPQQRAS